MRFSFAANAIVSCNSLSRWARLVSVFCWWFTGPNFDEWIAPSEATSAMENLLVFSVTPFKIDQNKNQNRSIDKVQNLGNERRCIYKDPRQDSDQRNISHTRQTKKCFTQTYRDLYGDAMLVLTWMSSNMADGNQQNYLLPCLATKAWIYSSRNS